MSVDSPGAVLIVAPGWVGDLIMAHSLVQLLHGQGARRVEMLAAPWAMPLVRRMPGVTAAHPLPVGHGQWGWQTRRRVARGLADIGFDMAVVLPNSWKSALVPFWAGIPRRRGYLGEARYGLLNDWRRLDKTALPRTVERFAALAFARQLTPPAAPQPRLAVDGATVANTLQAFALAASSAPLAILCPGAEYGPAKRWPTGHFAELANGLVGAGWQVWLLGGPADGPAARHIAAACGRSCLDLTGRTDLGQVCDLMSLADVVVTNDSGLMHLAAALDRPLVAVYGSTDPAHTPPLASHARVLWRHLPCSPCFARRCRFGHNDCLVGITPGQVLDAIAQLLPGQPTGQVSA